MKKGSVVVNATATVSADKKSVNLELASKLFEGEYTVNVTGLTDAALTGSVKVENEKVASVKLLSEVAPVIVTTNKDNTVSMKEATVGYQVLNQYGEDITSSPLASGIQWTASNGVKAVDNGKGVLNLTSPVDFKIGDKVAITGINAATNTVVSGSVTVSNASTVDSLTFQGIYNKDGKELTSDSTPSDFPLLVDVKDQYGNALKADKVNSDVVFTSSNESLVKVKTAKDGQGAKKDQVGLELQFGPNSSLGGKATITAISKTTGKVTQFEVNVKAASKLDSFTLSAPSEIVAAGDTVKIPFTAADQYGTAITKAKDITGVNFSATDGVVPVLKSDANGNAYVEYKPTTKGTKVIIVTTSTGKVSQLTLDVKDTAEPVTIESLKDVSTTLAVGGSATIELKNLVVKDQYGRLFDLKDKLGASKDKYQVIATETTDNDSVDVTGTFQANDGKLTVTGANKGSEDVTLTLQKHNGTKFEDVVTSPIKVTFNVTDKSAFTSYAVGDVGTIYADGPSDNTFTKDLKVYGVTAKGDKVLLPSKNFTVATGNDLLSYSDGKLDAKASTDDIKKAFGDKSEIKTTLTVVVDGQDSPVTLTKEVTISNAAPKADTVEFDSEKVTDGATTISSLALAGANDTAALASVLKVTDQYGETYSPKEIKVTATNLVDAKADDAAIKVVNNGTSSVDIQGASLNDTFVATYYVEGKTVSVKVKVVNPSKDEQIAAAQKKVDDAQANLDKLTNPSDAEVATANDTLAKRAANPSDADVSAANAVLADDTSSAQEKADAQKVLDARAANPSDDDVAAANDTLAKRDNYKAAEKTLDDAKKELDALKA